MKENKMILICHDDNLSGNQIEIRSAKKAKTNC